MLSNDMVAFFTQLYADNFVDICIRFLGAQFDDKRKEILYNSHSISIQINPISCDFDSYKNSARSFEVLALTQRLKEKASGKLIIARAERTELTKGIVEGFEAYREFLKMYPRWKDKVAFICWLVPSRLNIPLYKEMTSQIKNLVLQINREFSPGVPWNGIIETEEDWQASF